MDKVSKMTISGDAKPARDLTIMKSLFARFVRILGMISKSNLTKTVPLEQTSKRTSHDFLIFLESYHVLNNELRSIKNHFIVK